MDDRIRWPWRRSRPVCAAWEVGGMRLALERPELPDDLNIELTARAIRVFAEDAGRTLLTGPESYPPERYERFVRQVLNLVLPAG